MAEADQGGGGRVKGFVLALGLLLAMVHALIPGLTIDWISYRANLARPPSMASNLATLD